MGLDAWVHCDCYDKGKVRTPPPKPDLISISETGEVVLEWNHPDADHDAFWKWRKIACEHGESGELVAHSLGNIALIGFLRSLLNQQPNSFPILLGRVVCNGVHAGDFLSQADIDLVAVELDRLKDVHAVQPEYEDLVRIFESQMRDIVNAARSVGKPIVF